MIVLVAIAVIVASRLAARHNRQRRQTEWEQFGIVYGPRRDRGWDRYDELDALQSEREWRGDWGADK